MLISVFTMCSFIVRVVIIEGCSVKIHDQDLPLKEEDKRDFYEVPRLEKVSNGTSHFFLPFLKEKGKTRVKPASPINKAEWLLSYIIHAVVQGVSIPVC